MSCIFCELYNGLEKKCDCGVIVHNLGESFDCKEFQYKYEITNNTENG